MVLGVVECGEAVPVGLDLGSLGDIEAERVPDRLDALPSADHRVHAAAAAAARGQRHIQRFLAEARRELRVRELIAPRLERGLDSLLGGVELRAGHLALLRSSLWTKGGQLARLAEEARLRVLEGRDVARRAESSERAVNDAAQVARVVLQLVREVCFDLAGDLVERRLVGHRKIRENLAVDVDVRAFETRHEGAVAHAERAHRGVDARDPQRAEGALLVATVAVGVLPRLHQRLLGYAIDVLAAAAESLGLLEDFLVARARRDSTLDSWHGALLRKC